MALAFGLLLIHCMRVAPALALSCVLAACSSPTQQQGSESLYAPKLDAPRSISKVDMLFVVDNSRSMGDKQQVLSLTVPDLVRRLTDPRCINQYEETTEANADGSCPQGYPRKELGPLTDLHLGVISSSLGGHGADTCEVPLGEADSSHLLSRDGVGTGTGVETWANKGFLLWDPNGIHSPEGEDDAASLVSKFQAILRGAGQEGCGFEAPLEAWYRFLVEPAPYEKMVPYDCATQKEAADGQCRGPSGIDEVVLQQRSDFVRPDSLLVIVMLTDENDCSIIDGSSYYWVAQAVVGNALFHLPRGTSECLFDPESPACTSCALGDHSDDPRCALGPYDELEDSINLRCYRQKQRFGVDFLYPIRRYINALTRPTFSARDVQFPVNPGFAPDKDINPLFCSYYAEKDGKPDRSACIHSLRDPAMVLFTAIVGVPWQDLANDPADLKKGYRPVEELWWTETDFLNRNKARPANPRPIPPGLAPGTMVWDQILGKVNNDWRSPAYKQIDNAPSSEPLDPLMIESIAPRKGVNPATGAPLADSAATSPTANPINGHEWEVLNNDDLQYACIFPLPAPRECSTGDPSCDCAKADGMNNPVCQSEQGQYGTMQYRAKAYPGRRQLAVAHGLPPVQTVLASICPANLMDPDAEDYGYRPAVNALVAQMRMLLGRQCYGVHLRYAPDGSVPCSIVEAARIPAGITSCPPCESLPWRRTPDAALLQSVSNDPEVTDQRLDCLCEIPQATPGPALSACVTSREVVPSVDGVPLDGWCYVDAWYPARNANSALVVACPARRAIRFMGAAEPSSGALTVLRCRSPAP